MEDKKILRNADEFLAKDELTIEELQEVAGGDDNKTKTYICSQCGEKLTAKIDDSIRTVYMAHLPNCKGRKI